MQQASRININLFCQYAGKNEKGQRIVQGRIHEEIQEHINLCRINQKQNCGILAPFGHGKTEQLIFRVLDDVGKNQNIRIQYICNTDENATSRVSSIKKYIESDREYKAVYPGVVPTSDDWGKHSITIQRDSKAKDGTLEAWGITSAGTGSRADLQIFDDPVDLRNAILNPALRGQVKDSLKNVWFSRLVPGGFRIYIATLWHEDDATHDLLASPEWNFLVMRVSEDYSCIECDSAFKGKYTIPLWEVWNTDLLKSQRRLIGARAFDRGYRQKAMNDEDRTFPSSERIFDKDTDASCIQPHWPRITGIDPFGQAVVIYTIALNPLNHKRFQVEIKRAKWQPRETVRELIDTYKKHQPAVIVCENNAAQDAIIQWAHELGGLDLPIIPFTTGAQKANPTFGLPSLEVEFSNGAWCVPSKDIDFTDSENPTVVLYNELRGHPIAKAWDTIMAMWFSREGARFLLKHEQDIKDAEKNEEITTGEDVGIEQIDISSTY